jgi:hypothetical protein
VIAELQVHLGEECHAVQFIEELLHDGNGKFILHGDTVQCTVVHVESPAAVVFLNK